MNRPGFDETAARYLRFAEEEARGRSPLYEVLARGVAGDREILAFLSTLPREKRQPNLLLAVARLLFGTPARWTEFRASLMGNLDSVRMHMMTLSTQTNEPARCATLLPVLALLPQPLALIEVGASAGLCLLLDQYSYDYRTRRVHPERVDARTPVFFCMASELVPLPTAMPQIVWRAGIDLNPLDVSQPTQAAWLETLVWPGQTERLANLRAAIGIAATMKPRLIRGDLRGDLARLAEEAPKDATLVIFHTAVLAYVSLQEERESFAREAMSLGQFWISNESPRVFPEIAKRVGENGTPGRFMLSVNGEPVAWADPHGAGIEWIADPA